MQSNYRMYGQPNLDSQNALMESDFMIVLLFLMALDQRSGRRYALREKWLASLIPDDRL